MKKAGHKKQTAIASRRMQAWLYEVINPLIDGLAIERMILDSGHYTWRWSDRHCEVLRPMIEHLQPAARPLYDGFVRHHAQTKTLLDRHDDLLDNLNKAAGRLFDSLVSSEEHKIPLVGAAAAAGNDDIGPMESFAGKVRECLKKWKSEKPNAAFPSGRAEEDVRKELAELVVNKRESLPGHFVDAEFWGRFARELKDIALKGRQGSLDATVSVFQSHLDKLRQHLRDLREEICDTYDLPEARIGLMAGYVAEQEEQY